MRPDMFKVIVERPRLVRPRACGSAYPRGALRHLFERDLEHAPKHLGMAARHREKWLNENYGCQVLGATPRTKATVRLDRGRRPMENTNLAPRSEVWRIGGALSTVRFARLPAADARPRCFDVIVAAHLTPDWFDHRARLHRLYGRDDRYAASKRDVGRRELALVERTERPHRARR